MTDPFDFSRYAATTASSESRLPEAPAGELRVGHPPIVWLVVAAAAAVAAAMLTRLPDVGLPLVLVPWVLAGPVAMTLLGLFTLHDTRARALPVYTSGALVRPFYWAVVAVIAVGVILGALEVAFWFGRL